MRRRSVRRHVPAAGLAIASVTGPGSTDILLAASTETAAATETTATVAGADWLSLPEYFKTVGGFLTMGSGKIFHVRTLRLLALLVLYS